MPFHLNSSAGGSRRETYRPGPRPQPPVEETPPVQSLRDKFLTGIRDALRSCRIEGELDAGRLLVPTTINIDEEASRILQGDNQQPPELPHFIIYCAPGTKLENPNGAVRISTTDVWEQQDIFRDTTARRTRGLKIDVEQIVPSSGTIKLSSPKRNPATNEFFLEVYDSLGGIIRRIYLEKPGNQDNKRVALLIAAKGALTIAHLLVPSHWERLFDQNGRFKDEEKSQTAPPPPKAPEKPLSEEQRLAHFISSNPMEAWREIQKRVFAFPGYEGSLILPQGTRNAVVEGTSVHILQKRTSFLAQKIRFTLTLTPEQIAQFLSLCGNNQFEENQFRSIFAFRSGNQTANRLFIDAKIIFDPPDLPLGKFFLTAQKGRWNGLTLVEESPHPVSPEIFTHFLGLLKPAEQVAIFERQPGPKASRQNRKPEEPHHGDIRRAFAELEQSGTIFVGSQPDREPKKAKNPTSSRERKATRRAKLKAERNKGKKRK